MAIGSQNPIRDAVLAIADIHEMYARSPCDRVAQLEYPLEKYKKAVQQVCQLDVTKQENAVDFALAACVIFSCIEGIRGHYQSLLSHLRSGMRIMMQTEEKAGKTRISYLSREMLQRLFIGVNAQLMAYGDERLATRPNDPGLKQLPCAFESACQAMSALEHFYCELMQFYLSLQKAATDPRIFDQQGQDLLRQHEVFKKYFQQWSHSCRTVLDLRTPTTLELLRELSSEALIVLVTSVSMSIALEVDITDADMDMDRFEPEFRQSLMACEEFLRRSSVQPGHTPSMTTKKRTSMPQVQSVPLTEQRLQENVVAGINTQLPPTFSMRMGIVSHLYWAGSRCRDPLLRRWALSLLLTCNRREGLWDSTTCARIVARVIAIEENAATSYKSQLLSADQPTLTSSRDIGRSARVSMLWAKFEVGNRIRICYANLQDRSETMETLEV
ncbi:hypothetical protein H2200_002480 [Cladophialophora chaetospira]|uniref:Uncharacterized protein n=1 Tax=Cladophialophora chaetospira TaxID=386627 RepID=A0AA38XJ33_9EURO|nr:hypothetical protein H2200_002480 [Cladophialophora chaetospira]